MRRGHLSSGEAGGYERLLLAPGARPALPFVSTRVLGFGLLPHALVTGPKGSVAIIVPAGTSWTLPAYELALLSAGAGRDVRVVTAEAVAMEAFGPGTHAAVRSLLERHAIEVEAGRSLETART